jgi:hypothetical protein
MTIATLLFTTIIMKAVGFSGKEGMIAALCVGAVICTAAAIAGDTFYAKCRLKILKQLKTREQLTALEIRNLISDVTTSVLWSRRRLGVTKPVEFTNFLIKGMLKDGKIIEVIEGKNRVYKLSRE